MTEQEQFVRAFQAHHGLKVDGDPGDATYDALGVPRPRRPGALSRIIWHWTGGHGPVTEDDKAHYHFVIARDGAIVPGARDPMDNASTDDGRYAAHTLNCNTGSIGLAVDAMGGAVERPFYAGSSPVTETQIAALIGLTADLCRRYRIEVTPRTVLSHAEVEPTLGIPQRQKWDIAWLPGMASPQDPVGVGNILRARVLTLMKGA